MPVRTLIDPRLGVMALAVAAAALPFAVHAQDTKDQPPEIEALAQCRAILDPAERLGCYDRAAGAVLSATESGELRVATRDSVTKTRRRLFGFSLPDLDIFGDGDDENDELDELETTITGVRGAGRGVYVFQTEEGAVWQISNAPSRLKPPRPGQPVVFKKASLGSYFIRIDGQIGVKGRRVG